MSTTQDQQDKIERHDYEIWSTVARLRREVFLQADPSASQSLMDELTQAEQALEQVEAQRIARYEQGTLSGVIIDTTHEATHRGLATTGLEARVFLKMEHVPTSICHLFNVEDHPLIVCEVTAAQSATVGGSGAKRRVRVTSFIEKYSAKAVSTIEILEGESHLFKQLPTLFADEVRDLMELTRGTLNILVEDLDGKVEIHETRPIWLLARTSAPLSVKDPTSGQWLDMTRYMGAFVTPNAPSLMKFLRTAANYHAAKRLVGYQGSEAEVPSQVKALFKALKNEAQIIYINSVIDFNPDQSAATQRVRLPRESLADGEANCIDGTVLLASLLEAASLNPAIVIVPGHAFLAWETWKNSNNWRYIETTMIGTSTFKQACSSGENTAATYSKSKQLKLYPLSELRGRYAITPME